MARESRPFNDSDIIRFFLRNISGAEQTVVLCWFKAVVEEYLASSGIKQIVVDQLLDYLLGKIPFKPLSDALAKLKGVNQLSARA